MRKLLGGAGVSVLLVAAVVLVRASRLAPVASPPGGEGPASGADRGTDVAADLRFDEGAAVARFAEALRFPTVSYPAPAEPDTASFLALHGYLKSSFPRVHQHLRLERVGRPPLSLLYTWEGADRARAPVVLMGHQDVVPVTPGTEGDWTHPPFSGAVSDGYVWGRGAMDDKVSVLSILQAVDLLLGAGHRPTRTIYLAFGHDEELGGLNGAGAIAELLESRDVREYALVLDEGPGITDGLVPGIDLPVAAVGIAEKGYVSLRLTARVGGGHSSAPPAMTAIGILSDAVSELEAHPFPANLDAGGLLLAETLAPHMPLAGRLAFANRWLFDPVLERLLSRAPETSAMIRTTTAATMFSAGVKDNVLPVEAEAVVNFRILPGETVTSVIERVRAVIDDRVAVSVWQESGRDPSPFSDVDGPAFRTLETTIRTAHQGPLLVAPMLLLGGTDAAHFAYRSANVFRFLPTRLQAGDLERIHGTDERLGVDDYLGSVRFFLQLVKDVDALP